MVYTIPWNEAAPIGASTPADTIDTELQNLKISMRERLEDAFPDWDNDGIDPKTIDPALILNTLDSVAAMLALFPTASVSRVSSQSIPDDASTNVVFTTENWDRGDLVDLGVDDEVINLTRDGYWIIAGMCTWATDGASPTGYRALTFGGTAGSQAAQVYPAAPDTFETIQNIADIVQVSGAPRTVGLIVRHTRGSPLSISVATVTQLRAFYLGDL